MIRAGGGWPVGVPGVVNTWDGLVLMVVILFRCFGGIQIIKWLWGGCEKKLKVQRNKSVKHRLES